VESNLILLLIVIFISRLLSNK